MMIVTNISCFLVSGGQLRGGSSKTKFKTCPRIFLNAPPVKIIFKTARDVLFGPRRLLSCVPEVMFFCANMVMWWELCRQTGLRLCSIHVEHASRTGEFSSSVKWEILKCRDMFPWTPFQVFTYITFVKVSKVKMVSIKVQTVQTWKCDVVTDFWGHNKCESVAEEERKMANGFSMSTKNKL